jgi:hypothetical protein
MSTHEWQQRHLCQNIHRSANPPCQSWQFFAQYSVGHLGKTVKILNRREVSLLLCWEKFIYDHTHQMKRKRSRSKNTAADLLTFLPLYWDDLHIVAAVELGWWQ